MKKLMRKAGFYTKRMLSVHSMNMLVIGMLLGLIMGFFAFHEESAVDKRLREIAESSYPNQPDRQRQALRDFQSSLDELYVFSQSGGVDQARRDALDAEARADINNIHSKLELVYVSNGYYPGSLNQQTLDGITYEALVDREGGYIQVENSFEDAEPVNTFGGYTPEPRYRYAAYECQPVLERTNCQHYVLFAWLESGNVYIKKSLN